MKRFAGWAISRRMMSGQQCERLIDPVWDDKAPAEKTAGAFFIHAATVTRI